MYTSPSPLGILLFRLPSFSWGRSRPHTCSTYTSRITFSAFSECVSYLKKWVPRGIAKEIWQKSWIRKVEDREHLSKILTSNTKLRFEIAMEYFLASKNFAPFCIDWNDFICATSWFAQHPLRYFGLSVCALEHFMVYKKGPLDLVTHEQRRNCIFFVKVKRSNGRMQRTQLVSCQEHCLSWSALHNELSPCQITIGRGNTKYKI